MKGDKSTKGRSYQVEKMAGWRRFKNKEVPPKKKVTNQDEARSKQESGKTRKGHQCK